MKPSDRDTDLGNAYRDVGLGERLRRLEVPEHAPDFFASLEERLEAEAAPGGRAERGEGSERRGRQGRQVLPGRRAGEKRRSRLRLAWVAIPVAVVILALLWAFAGPLGIDVFRPQTASAAEVAKKVAAAVTAAEALRGTLVIVSPGVAGGDRDEMRWTFVSTAEGDFRLTGITRSEDLGYDHTTGVQRALSGGDNGEPVFASEMTGLAAGLPDPGPADYVLERHLGAVTRALLDSPHASVEEGTYEERPVWTLSADVQVNLLSDASADHMEVTVDQATGFPVRVVETRGGDFVQELRLEDLEIDPVLAADTFHLEFPAGVEVSRTDAGFSRVDFPHLCTDGAAVVGYAPMLPTHVPDGFILTDLAMAKTGQPTGKEGMNPPAPGVVSVIYRRGFDRLVISTRSTGGDPSLWSDPLASGEGFIDRPETVTLASGAFAGAKAEILIDPRSVPHLWAMNDSLVVTVSGDLTRDELLAVAESLAVAAPSVAAPSAAAH